MGAVYRAQHVATGADCALKVILPDPGGQPPDALDVARFRREAELLASVDAHPNVVRVHAAGEQSGTLFCAMELAEGESLSARLGRAGPLPADEAARLVEGIAQGVAHVHACGVLHRDLKPANVVVSPEGRPRLLDFGLALDPTMSRLTLTGEILGTPSFMAPEQVDPASAGAEIGPATDVYGLGGILYALLTGKPPIKDRDPHVALLAVHDHDATPPSVHEPGVPRELEAICLRALEKLPARRYGSALDLAADLGRWQRGEPVEARPPGTLGRLWRRSGRRGRAAIVVGVAAAAALAIVVGALSVWLASVAYRGRVETEVNVERERSARQELARRVDDVVTASSDAERLEQARQLDAFLARADDERLSARDDLARSWWFAESLAALGGGRTGDDFTSSEMFRRLELSDSAERLGLWRVARAARFEGLDALAAALYPRMTEEERHEIARDVAARRIEVPTSLLMAMVADAEDGPAAVRDAVTRSILGAIDRWTEAEGDDATLVTLAELLWRRDGLLRGADKVSPATARAVFAFVETRLIAFTAADIASEPSPQLVALAALAEVVADPAALARLGDLVEGALKANLGRVPAAARGDATLALVGVLERSGTLRPDPTSLSELAPEEDALRSVIARLSWPEVLSMSPWEVDHASRALTLLYRRRTLHDENEIPGALVDAAGPIEALLDREVERGDLPAWVLGWIARRAHAAPGLRNASSIASEEVRDGIEGLASMLRARMEELTGSARGDESLSLIDLAERTLSRARAREREEQVRIDRRSLALAFDHFRALAEGQGRYVAPETADAFRDLLEILEARDPSAYRNQIGAMLGSLRLFADRVLAAPADAAEDAEARERQLDILTARGPPDDEATAAVARMVERSPEIALFVSEVRARRDRSREALRELDAVISGHSSRIQKLSRFALLIKAELLLEHGEIEQAESVLVWSREDRFGSREQSTQLERELGARIESAIEAARRN